jgi:ribosomal protein L33
MAGKSKKGAQKLKLVYKDEEGKITYTYYTSKNFKTKTEKFKFMKYHPVLRKHVLFEEAKIK